MALAAVTSVTAGATATAVGVAVAWGGLEGAAWGWGEEGTWRSLGGRRRGMLCSYWREDSSVDPPRSRRGRPPARARRSRSAP